MNDTIRKLFSQLAEFWKKQSRRAKVIYISSVAGIILISLVLAVLLNQSPVVVLYNGLEASESSEIMARLSEMNVDATMSGNGTIYVPKNQEASLKMQLSLEGYPKTALSYDIFTQNTDFLTTDFEKKQYLVFQLQDRLQAAIMYLHQIKSAVVTLNIPDNNSYVLSSEKIAASASVLLKMEPGEELAPSQVKGIEKLVTKSVPGLKSENVSIVDGDGNQLNDTESENGLSASTRQQLEQQADARIKSNITALLKPVFGEKGYTVAVRVTLDFDKMLSEETTFTPVNGETGIISSIDKSTEIQGPETTGGVVGTETNADVPTYEEELAAAEGTSYYKSTQSVEYLVNQLKKQIQSDGGSIKNLSVAVVINSDMMTDDEKMDWTNTIAKAAGTDPENIALTSMLFAESEPEEVPVEEPGLIPEGYEWILYAAAGAAFLLILMTFLIVMLLKRGGKKGKGKAGKHGRGAEEEQLTYTVVPEKTLEPIPGAIQISETREQVLKKEIGDFSSQNPEIVAQLIRTWLKAE